MGGLVNVCVWVGGGIHHPHYILLQYIPHARPYPVGPRTPGVAGFGDSADDNSSSALTASVEVNTLGGVKGTLWLCGVCSGVWCAWCGVGGVWCGVVWRGIGYWENK